MPCDSVHHLPLAFSDPRRPSKPLSRILGDLRNPAPECRTAALWTRGNLCFSLEQLTALGWKAGWGTSFGIRGVSR